MTENSGSRRGFTVPEGGELRTVYESPDGETTVVDTQGEGTYLLPVKLPNWDDEEVVIHRIAIGVDEE